MLFLQDGKISGLFYLCCKLRKMTLITSISGIRGIIGGKPGEGLTPPDIISFTAAYCELLKEQRPGKELSVLIGRDARVSGEMVESLVASTLIAMGVKVFRGGMLSTPTVEMGVTFLGTDGGIIITASHNPFEWNALKLLNYRGEFITAEEGEKLLEMARADHFEFAAADKLGSSEQVTGLTERHIEAILNLPEVDTGAIAAAGFKVAVDAVNSVGGIAIPMLLEKLGVSQYFPLFCEPTGIFPHNPEPLPENLQDISDLVKKTNADVGFVVDPDVDRLAIIDEQGGMFGEEYTLVAVADHILSRKAGPTVSNLSSTMALKDITEMAGQSYYPSAVGEVNVVAKMKEVNAVIGGEGNGGVIYPDLHYGRDALAGIALFLSLLAHSKLKCSRLRNKYPSYFISKSKVKLEKGMNTDCVTKVLASRYSDKPHNMTDGIRIEFEGEWVHVRGSNTEPIMRIYAESKDQECADKLTARFVEEISRIRC